MKKEITEALYIKSKSTHEKDIVLQVACHHDGKWHWIDTKYGSSTIEGARATAEHLMNMDERWWFKGDRRLRIVKGKKK